MRVHYEKKSDEVRNDKKKSDGVRVNHQKMSDGVRVHQQRKSDGLRVHHQKEQWGENSPKEKAMG